MEDKPPFILSTISSIKQYTLLFYSNNKLRILRFLVCYDLLAMWSPTVFPLIRVRQYASTENLLCTGVFKLYATSTGYANGLRKDK